ncbi:MAG: peptidoglycan DD-metalloendopeptidase family protein [Desulfitobacteriaceae bacterium]
MKKLIFSQLKEVMSRIQSWISGKREKFAWKLPVITRLFERYGSLQIRLRKKLNGLSWKSPIVLSSTLVLVLVIGSLAIYLNNTISATSISVNGQRIGLIKSEDEGKALIEDILKKRGQGIGISAKTHDQIEYQNLRVKKVALLDQSVSESTLANKLSAYVNAWELVVGAKSVAVLPSQEDAQKVLEQYQDFYTKPSENNKVSSVSFAESVSFKQIEAQVAEVQLPDAVLKMLEDGVTQTKEYVVVPNDSWWLIARKNDMKTKEVLAGNPGMTEDSKLQPGQKVKLVSIEPYLTVLSKGVLTATETVPFNVVTKTDYSLGSGQTVVKQSGSDGSKIVTYSYEQKNGKNIAKTVLDEKVITAAVTQIVNKGPSRAPVTIAHASRGSGNVAGLGWPLQGHINSYYGYRWGGFHTGIDIGGDTGDPYVAAASGTVISAGWDGGYGKMILIDHGNGVLTRYAHSSQLLVSAGQHVDKGQTIGLVGATGNATGPHLHFEVISNGSTLNPLDYLP